MSTIMRKTGLVAGAIFACGAAFAADAAAGSATASGTGATGAATAYSYSEIFTVNNLWVLIATFLVFMMHLGFASLESGLTRAKNTVNILFKNTAIVAIGLLTYAFIGYNLMYPGDSWSVVNWLGNFSLGLHPGVAGQAEEAGKNFTAYTDFIFQGMFAATAATIVSGAVAERVKLGSFLVFSLIYVALVYPIVGSWGWGGGWLSKLDVPFHDFAGSTFVHSVGGWAALAAIIVLGPRIGKYGPAKMVRGIPGHSMPLAAIGVFLLWFGWYGFNGGSVLSADPNVVSLVFVTTSLAAAAGVAGAMILSWIWQKKPDLSMVLNGSLAGLVAVTAGADCISPMESIYIGFIGGLLVVVAVIFIDEVLRLDDPVGATSVHLVNGVWGTLAVGIWGKFKLDAEGSTICYNSAGGEMHYFSFMSQLKGVLASGVTCFIAALVLMLILKAIMGLRVSQHEEMQGLDIGEHGMEAYAGFQIFSNQ